MQPARSSAYEVLTSLPEASTLRHRLCADITDDEKPEDDTCTFDWPKVE